MTATATAPDTESKTEPEAPPEDFPCTVCGEEKVPTRDTCCALCHQRFILRERNDAWPTPKRYAHVTLSTLNAEQRAKADKFLAAFFGDDDRAAENLILFGSFGTGKTTLAAALANEVRAQGLTPVFAVAPEFLGAIRDSYKDKEGSRAIIDAAIEADLLVIDDVGKQKESEFSADVWFRVINQRHNEMRPTVITTNKSPVDFERDPIWGALSHRLCQGGGSGFSSVGTKNLRLPESGAEA